jgi:hypothetical protein
VDQGERRRWAPVVATALVVVLLLAGWAVMGQRGTLGVTGATPSAPASTSASGAPRTVELPLCADQSATDKMLLPATPDGPAKDAVSGTAVNTSFSLGDGAFTADPPPTGYAAAVTAGQAGCQLASAMGVRGFTAPPGRLALATVTIASSLYREPSVDAGEPATNANPDPLPTYQHRVAWVLISAANNNVSSCPTMAPSTAQAAAASAEPPHPYEVFGIDATTGGSPFMYEDPYALCQGLALDPASLSVPYQILSVPWKILSRAADGLSAQISASWSSCETYTLAGTTYATNTPSRPSGAPTQPATSANTLHAWVQPPHGDLAITVNRPFGADCGPASAHTLTLHPAVVGATIPAAVAHGPLGLVAPQVG